jgi:tetratricopeptide (TPR) repeat protein/predicted Ser/Thr protein kinase
MNPRATTDGERGTISLDDRKHHDAVCDRFEAAWLQGDRPDLESFLPAVDGRARAWLFRELLAIEVDYRRNAGETPDAEHYRRRFPEFAGVIDAAFTLSGSEARTVTPAPEWDPELTRRSTRPGESDPGDDVRRALRAAGYEVDEELGRGGMGVVYRAHQVALGRPVALKVIRSGGFASEAARRRFQNEAELVAQLDHPHIVPIFEVGASRGLNYFSMRLISGTSLDERLDEFSRDPRAAARLTATVAEAIHHAHQRGILHRDLKPANILVDAQGEPHVTDFGLARRVESETALTRSGAIVGTPSYMSPEQASGITKALTTATDVYGLGAVLYAMLTGLAPNCGDSFAAMLDQVRETPPVPPSKRNRRVARDLEIICLKCLEKAPHLRYPSALTLAEDLNRWLAGQPIAARPVAAATRVAMWCRRHPLPAVLMGLLVLSLLAGLAGVTWKWRDAVEERGNSASIEDFLGRMIAASSTEVNPRGSGYTVLAMLDRAADRIGGDFQGRPRVEARVHERVGRAYLSLGEYGKAEAHLRTALKLTIGQNGPEDPAVLRVQNALAVVFEESGRRAEAETLLRRHLEVCRQALGAEAEITLEAADLLGVVLRKQGKLDQSETLLKQTLDSRRRVLRAGHPDTLRSIRNLCLLELDRGRFRAAEALAHQYEHGIYCARGGQKHPDYITALANQGLIRLLQGRRTEAEPYYGRAVEAARRILGSDHPVTQKAVEDHARVVREIESESESEERKDNL